MLALLAVGGIASTSTVAAPPPPVDLSRADSCDFIGAQEGSLCLLPFPDDYYTVRTPAQRHRPASQPLDAGMPQNSAASRSRRRPTTSTTASAPARRRSSGCRASTAPAAFAATDPIPLNDLSRNDELRANEPIVVIDARDRRALADLGRARLERVDARGDRAPDPPGAQLRRRPSLHRRDAEPDGRATARRSRPDGLPLLPRRPALARAGDQRAARALREHLRDADEAGSSARTSTSPGTSPSPATRTSPSGCSHPRRRVRAARRHRPRRRRVQGGAPRSRDPVDTGGRAPRSRAGSRGRSRSPATCPTARPARASSSARTGCRARTGPGRRTSTASIPRAAVDDPGALGPAGRRSTGTACSAAPARRPPGPADARRRRTTSSSAPPTRSASPRATSRTSSGTSSPTSATSPSSPTGSSRACSTSSSSGG